jgi:carbon monoxide dehydrogenase subunit G
VTRVHVERTIAAPPERVFDWLAEPRNMTAAPAMIKCEWVNGAQPEVGAHRLAISPLTWIREEITAYDPPRSYSYRIVRAYPAFDHEGGTLTVTPSGAGTHVDWQSTYRHPWWVGGPVLEAVTRRALRSSFTAILAGCARALEG